MGNLMKQFTAIEWAVLGVSACFVLGGGYCALWPAEQRFVHAGGDSLAGWTQEMNGGEVRLYGIASAMCGMAIATGVFYPWRPDGKNG